MRNLIHITLMCVMMLFSSCLKMGLDDLPVYESAELTNVRFEYRWWDETAKQMRVVQMSVKNSLDNEAKTLRTTISVPATTNVFTKEIRDNVSLANLCANVDISTAAQITPLNNAPQLGVPADFSAKEFTYQIVAADGKTKANWTIQIQDFIK